MVGRVGRFCHDDSLLSSGAPLYRSTDKGREQRMGFCRLAFELGVKLHRKIKRMRWEFKDFHEASVWALARESHAVCFEATSKDVVELVTMSMSLGNTVHLVGHLGDRVLCQYAGLGSQSHGSAHVRDVALLI